MIMDEEGMEVEEEVTIMQEVGMEMKVEEADLGVEVDTEVDHPEEVEVGELGEDTPVPLVEVGVVVLLHLSEEEDTIRDPDQGQGRGRGRDQDHQFEDEEIVRNTARDDIPPLGLGRFRVGVDHHHLGEGGV
jgi:hypothetical protein